MSSHLRIESNTRFTVTIGGPHKNIIITGDVPAEPKPIALTATPQTILAPYQPTALTRQPNQQLTDKLLLQADPTQQHLKPIINLRAYQNIRDDITLGFSFGGGAAFADTCAFLVGFGGAGLSTLVFLIPGILTTSAAAYYLTTSLPKLRTINPWAAAKTQAHLTAWLNHNYNITPATFKGKPAYIIQSFNGGAGVSSFADTTGHHYQLHFTSTGKTLLIDEWGKTVKPIQHTPLAAAKTVRAPKPALDPELQPFTRKNRTRITAIRQLISTLRDGADLTTEQTFNLGRDEQILTDTINIAAKLDTLPPAARKQGFNDLDVALNTISANLAEISHGQNRNILRQARILARYTSSLRQTPGDLDLS